MNTEGLVVKWDEGDSKARFVCHTQQELDAAIDWIRNHRPTARIGGHVTYAYAVVGHYCATDANPNTDADDYETALLADTHEEAEEMLSWFPGGRIVPINGAGLDLRKAADLAGDSHYTDAKINAMRLAQLIGDAHQAIVYWKRPNLARRLLQAAYARVEGVR